MGHLSLQNPYLCRYHYGHAKYDSVVQLQERLNEVEPTSMLIPDGYFGEKTHDAVIKYQQRMRIRVDGIVGPETLGCLNSVGDFYRNDSHTLLNSNGSLLGNNSMEIRYNEVTGRYERYISEDINVPITRIGTQEKNNDRTIKKLAELILDSINGCVSKIIKFIPNYCSLYTNIDNIIPTIKKQLLANRNDLISSFFKEKQKIIETLRKGFLSNDDLIKNSERFRRCNQIVLQHYKDFNYRLLLLRFSKIIRKLPCKQLVKLGGKVLCDPVIMVMNASKLLVLYWNNDGTSEWEKEYVKAAYKFYDDVIEYIFTLIIGMIAAYGAIALGASSCVALAVIGVVMAIVGIVFGIVNAILDYKDNDREKLSAKAMKWACQFM